MLLRILFSGALCALVLCPLLAANSSIDAGLGLDGPAGAAPISAGTVMTHLRDMKTEIRRDLCRRPAQHYCLAQFCLAIPLPAQCPDAGPPPADAGS
jgi:hypothetical protein